MNLQHDLRRLVELTDEIGRTEELLAGLKEERGKIEQQVVHFYRDEGIDSVKVDKRSCHLRRDLYARPANGMPDLVAAMREAGFEDYVQEQVNASRLSALVREFVKQGQPLPSPLEGAVAVAEVYRIGVTK